MFTFNTYRNIFSIVFLLVSILATVIPLDSVYAQSESDLYSDIEIWEPFHGLMSPDGSKVLYFYQDSVFINNNGKTKSIASGASTQSARVRPFAAWSPDSERIFFRCEKKGHRPQYQIYNIISESFELIIDSTDSEKFRSIVGATLAENIGSKNGLPAWSPNGNRIAFLGWIAKPAFKPDLQVWVIDLLSGSVSPITTDPIGKTGFVWEDDANLLISTRKSKAQNSFLLRFNIEDNSSEKLLENEKAFGDLLLSPDKKKLWLRVGRNGAIALIDKNGKTTISNDNIPRKGYIGWTKNGLGLLFSEGQDSSAHIGVTDIESNEIHYLTNGPDVHRLYSVSNNDPNYLLFTKENGVSPADLWRADFVYETNQLTNLTQLTYLDNELSKFGVIQSKLFYWNTANGRKLNGQLIHPDHPGPYPLLIIPYGSYSNDFPGADYFLYRKLMGLVLSGWAVIRPNTRGISSERQEEGYGQVQLVDTEMMISQLVEKNIADSERISLLGHSHGAAMVLYYLTHSTLFTSGIAVNGPIDWISQAKHPLMTGLPGAMGGTSKEVPDIYKKASPHKNLDRLHGDLLVVVGLQDEQIVPEYTIKALKEINQLGIRTLFFENEDHILQNETNIDRLWKEINKFLSPKNEKDN